MGREGARKLSRIVDQGLTRSQGPQTSQRVLRSLQGTRSLLVGLLSLALSVPSATLAAPIQLPETTTKGAGPTRELPPLVPPIPIKGLDTGPATPLEFSRAWLERAEGVRQRRAELLEVGELDGVAPDSLVELGAALSGTLRIPVIPVRYSNIPEPFPYELLEDRIFGSTRGDTMTLASYWHEVSGGLLEIEGEVTPWVTLRRPGRHYLHRDEYGWASFGRAPDLVRDALDAASELIDFSEFDSDGPDGIPNSGDDDGFVDLVVILYALPCTGEWRDGAIWPHRGAIPPYTTTARSANGEPIRVSDYLILPVQEPGTCEPLQIGLLAHETGHALGLPDLYEYDGPTGGAGPWDLMANGTHNALHSPAHPSAWSKEQLGWVQVDWIEPGTDTVEIPPVAEAHRIFRYDLPTEPGQYILLENRQKIGSDSSLPATGLVAWRIDPERAALGSWNGIGRYLGVELIAEGGATSFPGPKRRDHIDFEPEDHLSLREIMENQDGSITAEIRAGYSSPTLVVDDPIHLMTALDDEEPRSYAALVRTKGGAPVEWRAETTARWARLERHGDLLLVTADPAGLEAGFYTDTVYLYPEPLPVPPDLDANGTTAEPEENGDDDFDEIEPLGSVAIHLEIADPKTERVLGTDLPWGWGLAVHDGRVLHASFGRDALSLRPRPRLLRLPGRTRKVETLAKIGETEALYAPLTGPYGETYLIGATNGANRIYQIDPTGRIRVLAELPGTEPAYGLTRLEDGRLLVADWIGKIYQVTPDGQVAPWVDLGRRVYQITIAGTTLYAADASGDLIAYDTESGELELIPTGFGRGRLVALTSTSAGEILIAERGGRGRILLIKRDRDLTEVARIRGGEFYGLTADDDFLYTLDLGHRQILRMPLEGLTMGEFNGRREDEG